MQKVGEKTDLREWVVIDNQGVRLFGVLHRPLHVFNPPVVVILHGFRSSKHGSNRAYVILAESLAKEGIAVLRFDFRGSGDSEGSLNEASLEDLISDGLAVCQYLYKLDGVNGSHLGVFGVSLGGAIAIEALARKPLAKALALWAPVASGQLWLDDFITSHPECLTTQPKRFFERNSQLQLTPLFQEQFANLVAYSTLSSMPDLPVLHMQGGNDTTTSISHQKAFKTHCSANMQFLLYPEEKHSLGYARVFPKIIDAIITFFKEHLQ
ncbi:MAG: alpha/beta hydrolase [Chlamydiales bacterium]